MKTIPSREHWETKNFTFFFSERLGWRDSTWPWSFLPFLAWKPGLPCLDTVFGVCSVNLGQVCEGCKWRCHTLPVEMITLLFPWILTLLYALSTHVRSVNENGLRSLSHLLEHSVCSLPLPPSQRAWLFCMLQENAILILLFLNPWSVRVLLEIHEAREKKCSSKRSHLEIMTSKAWLPKSKVCLKYFPEAVVKRQKNTVDIQYNDTVSFYYYYFFSAMLGFMTSLSRQTDLEWSNTVQTVCISSTDHFSGLIVSISFSNNGVLFGCFLY